MGEVKEVKEVKLETLFASLDGVVKELEEDSLSLEDAFTFYHKGMDLLKVCNEKIDTIEKQVLILDEDGESHGF